MRYFLAALVFVVFVAGCASEAEDRAFFNEGWLHPEKGAEERLNRI